MLVKNNIPSIEIRRKVTKSVNDIDAWVMQVLHRNEYFGLLRMRDVGSSSSTPNFSSNFLVREIAYQALSIGSFIQINVWGADLLVLRELFNIPIPFSTPFAFSTSHSTLMVTGRFKI